MNTNKNRFLFHVICIIGIVGSLILSGCAEGPDRDIEHKIFLTHADLSLIEGDEVQITASPTNQSFTWESSNAAVVTVSSTGLVSAVGDGACFIYVASNEGLKRTIPVDVLEFIPLSGIEVINAANLTTMETISILNGRSINLAANAVPENYNERVPFNVTWESKDGSIVAIDETTGTLHALDFGSTEIVVSSVEKPDVKKVIPVEVPIIPITEIVVPQTSLNLTLEQTVTLSTSFLPADYSVRDESLVWSSSDPSVVTVTNGVIKVIGLGQATVTVSLNSDPSVYTDIPVSVESSVINISQFKGTGLNDNLIYKRMYFEKGVSINVQGLTAADISAAYNRDFMEWNSATETLTFTGETGPWDVYYSGKYKYFWIRRDEDASKLGVYWLRGAGFTQAPVWHSELAGSSGGLCWGLNKVRFAAYMKPIGNNKFQASIYIAPESVGLWITVKQDLCNWTDPPGTPLTLVAPPGFAASNTDINKRPDGFTGGYYRLTIDLDAKQRILEKID